MAYTHSVLVTGGTQNLGYYAALSIAKVHPEYLIMISSLSNKENAAASINTTLDQTNTIFRPLDLASLANVRKYAADWAAAEYPPIQALVLNTGLQFLGALQMTGDGLESTFAINHVGHALLFHLLGARLADGARVVLTASGTHDPAQKSGLPDANYTTAEELAQPDRRSGGSRSRP
jgi:NAD(P)-dependent dehydrogenase (short-subunit alcohol dehydrogenase family)